MPKFIKDIFLKVENSNIYLKLKKTLYKLKQALKAWFQIVKFYFLEKGLIQSNADPNLFIERDTSIYILLYIDDMLIVRRKIPIKSLKAKILSK